MDGKHKLYGTNFNMKANEFIKQIFAPVFMTLKGAVAASFRPRFAADEDGFVRFGDTGTHPDILGVDSDLARRPFF